MLPSLVLVSSASKHPIAYASDPADALAKIARHKNDYPDLHYETQDAYWKRVTMRTMATFPLSRVSEEFYYDMLDVLPPVYNSQGPGFFVSEAAHGTVHAQFISHRGRFYGGYADVSKSGRRWNIADIDAFEAQPDDQKQTLTWYPEDA